MRELLTAAQMRAIEKAAIDSGEVTGLELMERAGQGVVEAIFEEWPELAEAPGGGAAPTPPGYLGKEEGGRRAVVLCGPGNNGGDGFVVARLLKEWGWAVEVFLCGDARKLSADAKVNYERWGELGEVVNLSFPTVTDEDVERFEDAAYHMSATEVIVDAIFGIGISRSIAGLSPLFGYNDLEVGVGDRLTPARHISVDLPSGMYCDDPQPPEYLSWFLADLTVTFHCMKRAHVDPNTTRSCGKVIVKAIGLEKWGYAGKGKA